MNSEKPRKKPPPLPGDSMAEGESSGHAAHAVNTPPPSIPAPSIPHITSPAPTSPGWPAAQETTLPVQPARTGATTVPAFTARPTQKKRGPLFVILVCLGVLVAGVGGLVTMGFFYEWTASDITLTPEQKENLFTAEDFSRWDGEWERSGGKETYTGRKYIDGSIEMEYEFDDESDDFAPYIYSLVTLENNTSDARSTYAGQKVGGGLGEWWENDTLEQEGIEIISRDGIFSWGDDSNYSVYQTQDGVAYGAQFSARKGKAVVYIIVSGNVNADVSVEVSRLLTPALERIDTH